MRVATAAPPLPLAPPFEMMWKRWNARSQSLLLLGSVGVTCPPVSKLKYTQTSELEASTRVVKASPSGAVTTVSAGPAASSAVRSSAQPLAQEPSSAHSSREEAREKRLVSCCMKPRKGTVGRQ